MDVFTENEVVSTESTRQHKDATDLVAQPYQDAVGTLVRSDHKGISNQYVGDDKCIVESHNLIRRLTPLECERLQGFPDGWTNNPGGIRFRPLQSPGQQCGDPMRGVCHAWHRHYAEIGKRRLQEASLLESNNSTHGSMSIVQIGKSPEKMHRRMDAKHDLIVKKISQESKALDLSRRNNCCP